MIDIDRFGWSKSDIRRLNQNQMKRPPESTFERMASIELPTPNQGEKFVRGPVPLYWLKVAIPLGRKSPNVAWALWFLSGFKRSNPVKLTSATLAVFGVTTETARSILKRYEQAGLVTVDRQRGRSPIVAIQDPPSQVLKRQMQTAQNNTS